MKDYIEPAKVAIVIPVYHKRAEAGYAVYEMPDCQGGWLQVSLEAHKAYIHNIDQKHGGKAKELIRLIKAWKYYQGIDISSYYLELVVAKYAERRSALTYSTDLKNLLDWLNKTKVHIIWDPTGISGRIIPRSNTSTGNTKLLEATRYAIKAVDEENKGNTQAALEYWDLLFKHKFLPSEP